MFAWYPIDAPPRIAETLILSLTCVDALLGKDLKGIFLAKIIMLISSSKGCVDLGSWNPCCVVVQKHSSPPLGLMRFSWKRQVCLQNL